MYPGRNLPCPHCGAQNLRVYKSFPVQTMRYRYYKCRSCGRSSKTKESGRTPETFVPVRNLEVKHETDDV